MGESTTEIEDYERSSDGGWYFVCDDCRAEHRVNPTFLPHPWTQAVCRACGNEATFTPLVHRAYDELRCRDCKAVEKRGRRWGEPPRQQCAACQSANVLFTPRPVDPPFPSLIYDIGLHHCFGKDLYEDSRELHENFRGVVQSTDRLREGRALADFTVVVEGLYADRPTELATLVNNLGVLSMDWYKLTGDTDSALHAIRRFTRALEGELTPFWRALTLHNLGIIKWRLGSRPDDAGRVGLLANSLLKGAAVACLEALRLLETDPPEDPSAIGRIRGLLGQIYEEPLMDEVPSSSATLSQLALEQYRRALDTLRPEDRFYGFCLTRLARNLVDQADLLTDAEAARTLLLEAEQKADEAIRTDAARGPRIDAAEDVAAFHTRGMARFRLGRPSEARADAETLVSRLERQLEEAESAEAQRAFCRTHGLSYLTVSLMLAEMGQHEGALAMLDRPLAITTFFQRLPRDLREKLHGAAAGRNALRTLMAMFGVLPGQEASDDDGQGPSRLQEMLTAMNLKVDVHQAMKSMRDGPEALSTLEERYREIVKLTTDDDRAFLLVAITHGKVFGYLIVDGVLEPLPRNSIHEADIAPILKFTTRNFLNGKRDASDEDSLTSCSVFLEQAVFAWVRKRLRAASKRRLVIVPYGILSSLPFAVSGGSEGLALVEEFEIASSPSLLMSLLPPSADAPADGPDRAVVIGNADRRLTFAADEVRGVAATLESKFEVDVLTGLRCDRRHVLQALAGKPKLVHITGHGSPDYYSSEREAFVVGPSNSESANHIISNRDLRDHMQLAPGATVVLSYCSGLLSRTGEANDLQGLPATFLEQGANYVVGALWPVADEVATTFMETFYGALIAGHDAVTATTTAQRKLRKAHLKQYLWAPFSVISS